MRLTGVMVVRNEEDVVETSIRHNLRVLDALAVVDHASTDATPGILASLVAEGLPLALARDDSLGALPGSVPAAAMARELDAGADVCLMLGGDDFLRMPSRPAFEAAVAHADPAAPLALARIAYLPALEGPGDMVARLRKAERRRSGRAGLAALERRGAARAAGGIAHDERRASSVVIDESIAAVAQVPVRGVEQYMAKVAVGHLAALLGSADADGASLPYASAFEAMRAGQRPTVESLRAIVAAYGAASGPDDSTRGDWTPDPFLADIELRYTPARPPVPLAQLLAFGERVAAGIAETTGGL